MLLLIMTVSTTQANLITAMNCGNHVNNDDLKQLAKDLNRARPTGLLTITTKFLGPTNTKGSRIRATINGVRTIKTVGYDHALHTTDAHHYAALALLSTWFEGEQLEFIGMDDTPDGKGFSFVYRFV